MDIGRTEGISGSGGIEGNNRVNPVNKPGKTVPPHQNSSEDKLEISDIGHYISELSNLPSVRHDKIEQIRKAIEDGKFETPERLEGAINKFLEENSE